MAVPKKKHTRSRSNKRRNTNNKRKIQKMTQRAKTSLSKSKRI